MSKCVVCGKPPARTPELNIATRKGVVHVSCVVKAGETRRALAEGAGS